MISKTKYMMVGLFGSRRSKVEIFLRHAIETNTAAESSEDYFRTFRMRDVDVKSLFDDIDERYGATMFLDAQAKSLAISYMMLSCTNNYNACREADLGEDDDDDLPYAA